MNKPKSKMKISVVEETNLGLYAWKTDKGFIKNEDGDYLCVPSMKGDRRKIHALRDAAYYYMKAMGAQPHGEAVFLAGHRAITDEEYEEQKARQRWGLVPDPYDVGSMRDDLRNGVKFS